MNYIKFNLLEGLLRSNRIIYYNYLNNNHIKFYFYSYISCQILLVFKLLLIIKLIFTIN